MEDERDRRSGDRPGDCARPVRARDRERTAEGPQVLSQSEVHGVGEWIVSVDLETFDGPVEESSQRCLLVFRLRAVIIAGSGERHRASDQQHTRFVHGHSSLSDPVRHPAESLRGLILNM